MNRIFGFVIILYALFSITPLCFSQTSPSSMSESEKAENAKETKQCIERHRQLADQCYKSQSWGNALIHYQYIVPYMVGDVKADIQKKIIECKKKVAIEEANRAEKERSEKVITPETAQEKDKQGYGNVKGTKGVITEDRSPCPKPVVDVVEKILKYWIKGDYISPLLHWVNMEVEGENTYIHLLNVKGYKIVNTDHCSYGKYEDAIITVRIQSTTQDGSPIEELWKFGLSKEKDGTWKVNRMVEGESMSLEALREDIIQTLKENE